MKTIAICAVLAITLTGTNAFAQAKNFEGFSVGGQLNMVKSGYEGNVGSFPLGFSDNDTTFAVQLDYTSALNDQVVLGFGADIGLSEAKSGKLGNVSFTSKNINTFYIAPGIAVSDKVMLFGKLGLLKTTGSTNLNSSTEDFEGNWIGAGARVLLSKDLYMQAEYGQGNFTTKTSGSTSYRPTLSGFSFGVGYKF